MGNRCRGTTTAPDDERSEAVAGFEVLAVVAELMTLALELDRRERVGAERVADLSKRLVGSPDHPALAASRNWVAGGERSRHVRTSPWGWRPASAGPGRNVWTVLKAIPAPLLWRCRWVQLTPSATEVNGRVDGRMPEAETSRLRARLSGCEGTVASS